MDESAELPEAGCMLSALCALKCGDGTDSFEAAAEAAETWRHCAERAGETVDEKEEGIGSFQIRLLDALSLKMEMERGRRMEVQSRMKQNKKDIFHRSSSGFMR